MTLISIVICHTSEKLLNNLTQNIEQSIGVAYDLIVVDNTKNEYSIFEAYNLGVKRSKGEFICFIHEDIVFHTKKWGNLIISHFEKNKDLGIIGTVGGSKIPACPAPWWNSHPKNLHFINNIQHWNKGTPPKHWLILNTINHDPLVVHQYSNPTDKQIADVTALDGFFMVAQKKVFNEVEFDSILFDGFHSYDTDICLQIKSKNWRVAIVFDILIEHLSDGSPNKSWCINTIKLAKKWQSYILTNSEYNSTTPKEIAKPLLSFCYKLQQEKFSDEEIREVIKSFFNFPFKIDHLTKDGLLLHLWKKAGYKKARLPYKLCHKFIKA
jgi:GT2 family glycosyltransferase